MRPWLTSGRLLPGLTAQRLLTQGLAVQLQNKTMNAETAGHVGTPQLKQFLMVNIKTKFPRGINSDQVISLRAHDGECERAPGPGLMKLQATSKYQAFEPTWSTNKRQASQP